MDALMKYREKLPFLRGKSGEQKAENKAENPKSGKKILSYALVQILLLALGLNLLIELLNHKGFMGLLGFIGGHPVAFFANYMIILVTLMPALFFKRRLFYMGVVGVIWATGGIANGIILLNRMTPFTTADLAVFATGFEILPTYFTKVEMVLLALCVIIVIAAAVLLFIKGPKAKVPFSRRLMTGAAATVLTACALALTIRGGLQSGGLSTIFSNLAYAYEDYGFGYCFANTWLNVGIRTPNNYSSEDMDRIVKQMDQNNGLLPQGEAMTDVNVIYVQLESFFDPQQLKGLEFNQDPLPIWHEMQKKYSTGFLTVPVVGAGTANTETEILTGMSTRFFGPGEYPYKTILKDHTAESVAHVLKELGYGTHAIHNHRGVFYGRNKVYKNLGFDTFTSLEYMANTTTTPKNWCRDDVLTGEIEAALDNTEGPDLVYTVSVQGHGKYPTEPLLEDPVIKVTAIDNEKEHYSMEYYANQIYEMDLFIGELTEMLEKRDEKTILVLYGDHLPALRMHEDELLSHDLYKTEYVIWNNFGLEKEDEPVKAYQLTAKALGSINITDGVFNRYHQTCKDESTYLTDLRKLQFDQLYGKKYLSGGKDKYQPTDMKMGVRPIKVTGYIKLEDTWYLEGENLTPYSKATVNGKILETEYLNGHLLRVIDDKLIQTVDDVSDIKISQVEKYNEVLSVTE